jgi:cysteine-rich repeat protein
VQSRVAAIACALAGCLDPEIVRCADGLLCPAGRECDTARGTCVSPGEPRCGDGIVSPAVGETCDDGAANGSDASACDSNCTKKVI